jgi:hypothetical protein
MINRRNTNLFLGCLWLVLLFVLLAQIKQLPGGLILPGWLLGGIMLIGILIADLFIAGILKYIFKTASFPRLFTIISLASLLAFCYKLYSPELKITVPVGYRGEVNLVLADIKENMLVLDSNGIGYLNQWTFSKTYLRPYVIQRDGKNLDSLLQGFNPSTFFAQGKTCCIGKKQIHSLSFDIGTSLQTSNAVPILRNLIDLVDTSIVVLMPLDKYSTVDEIKVDYPD